MMNYMKSAFILLCYLDKELVAIGYLDNFDLDFIFLNDTHQIIIDERYLLQKGASNYELDQGRSTICHSYQ